MNINATFFIQIINFYFFYWLLRTFLFKPTIRAIDVEFDEKVMLVACIDQNKISMEIKEKERQHAWYVYREYFKSQRPCLNNVVNAIDNFRLVFYDQIHSSSTTEDESNLIAQVYKKLEEKIKHVH